ncbi:MAG: DUF2948 family protein [Alphaproteobacteria bacterium]
MIETNLLKLAAVDEEDLAVVSTFVQDAVLKVGDMIYLPRQDRFALAMNRFGWEAAGARAMTFERRRAALVFDRVRAVRTTHIDRERPDAILELLAVRFQVSDPPEGTIELSFAGGGGVQLDVECIETRLTDLGAAWSTDHKPWHAVTEGPNN